MSDAITPLDSTHEPATPFLVDAWGVRCALKDEAVGWSELIRVRIVTTDEGPWCEDAFWLLEGRDGTGCVVPNAFAETSGLVSAVGAHLPGFDYRMVVEAMTSTDHAEFLCWQAPEAA